MKHKILLFAALLTIAGACSKEKPAEKVAELYPVRFNLSGLGVEYAPITKAGTTPPVTFVKYLIFQNNAVIAEKTIEITKDEDLSPEIYIPSGDSKVCFAAGGEGVTSADAFSLSQYGNEVRLTGDYIELFAAVADVNPGNNTAYDVELERVTGAIQLVILDIDKAPAGASATSFNVTFVRKPAYYSALTGGSGETSYATGMTAAGSVSAGTGTIHALPASEQSLKIQVSNSSGVINTYNVTAAVYKNRKTIIKGNVYGGTPNFSITIAEGWGENNEVVF